MCDFRINPGLDELPIKGISGKIGENLNMIRALQSVKICTLK